MARARIDEQAGEAAVRSVLRMLDAAAAAEASMPPRWAEATGLVPREPLALAVRYLLQCLGDAAPGRTAEMRVPPFGAVQVIEGPRHTRGTPPNIIETDPLTWVALATGRVSWAAVRDAGRVSASGSRADLSTLLPLAGWGRMDG